MPNDLRASAYVASRADAWIETMPVKGTCGITLSRPARTRGLKQREIQRAGIAYVASRADAWIETNLGKVLFSVGSVASRADAWIETDAPRCHVSGDRSRPSRTRGLKPAQRSAMVAGALSRPSRTRGLKQNGMRTRADIAVASLADAWIETPAGSASSEPMPRRVPRGRVD